MAREVVLSPAEETSILIEGNFDQNIYSKNLKLSLFKSLAMDTKISDEIKFMSGMSGKKYRYLINHLVYLTEKPRYLEIGCWAGSTICSVFLLVDYTWHCVHNTIIPQTNETSLELEQTLAYADKALRQLARAVVLEGDRLHKAIGTPLVIAGALPEGVHANITQSAEALHGLRTWAFSALVQEMNQ